VRGLVQKDAVFKETRRRWEGSHGARESCSLVIFDLLQKAVLTGTQKIAWKRNETPNSHAQKIYVSFGSEEVVKA
jgi:hypothetical protein